ncbi:MAG TPA: hydroxyacylglutathione hydrolase [Stellaceae bacterium]|nr:hydroxyacylglutathione hydrolase [Stellaceae bacterium]
MALDIRLVPLLTDNYAYLLHDYGADVTAVVDPAEAIPVLRAAESAGWHLQYVLNTHHHADHTGGNRGIVSATGATVAAPAAERDRIPEVTVRLKDGDTWQIGEASFLAIATPGHTLGQISYYSAGAKVVFTGDTLFALGCGRVFEGTPAQLWHSLLRLRALPDHTKIYCGHEYTEANCRFALTIEPENEALVRRADEIRRLRAAGLPTIPSTIGLERATNPFFRADEPSVQKTLGMAGADPEAVFAEIRHRKDIF